MKSQDNHSQQHYEDSAGCQNQQATGAPHNLSSYARQGFTECVRLLLAAPGIDVNKAANGVTPLDCATGEGHTECARLIRAAGGK